MNTINNIVDLFLEEKKEMNLENIMNFLNKKVWMTIIPDLYDENNQLIDLGKKSFEYILQPSDILLKEKSFNLFMNQLNGTIKFKDFSKEVINRELDRLKIEQDHGKIINEERILEGGIQLDKLKNFQFSQDAIILVKDDKNHLINRLKRLRYEPLEQLNNLIINQYEKNEVDGIENLMYQAILCQYAFNDKNNVQQRKKTYDFLKRRFDISEIEKNYVIDFLDGLEVKNNYIRFPILNKEHVMDMMEFLGESSSLLKAKTRTPSLLIEGKIATILFIDEVLDKKNEYIFVIENYLPTLISKKDCEIEAIKKLRDFYHVNQSIEYQDGAIKKAAKI